MHKSTFGKYVNLMNLFFTDCLANEHKCRDGICVSPAEAECNDEVDCLDFSDEGLQCNACKPVVYSVAVGWVWV